MSAPVMPTGAPKPVMSTYSAAFSLLDADLPIATAIRDATGLGGKAFLYSEHQAEIKAAGDGRAFFTQVFQTAKVCVVLYRAGWGVKGFSGLERRVIDDRIFAEDISFLVFVRMDNTLPPPWFPKHHIWTSLLVDGVDGVAKVIAARVATGGTLPHAYVTARSLDRRSAPLARYNLQMERMSSVWVTLVSIVCDGCSAAIHFRKVTTLRLAESKFGPAIEERFCPACARLRGSYVQSTTIPNSVGVFDVTTTDTNPTVAEFANHVLLTRGYQALRDDPELKALGVTSVGGSWGKRYLTPHVSFANRPSINVTVDLDALQASLKMDWDIVTFVRAALLEAVIAGS